MNTTRKKIAIVGCGWLGSSLAEFYLEQGDKVFGTTRTPAKANSLKNLGVEPFLLNSFEDDLSWLGAMDFLVLNIPPSAFKDNYAQFMVHIVRHTGTQTKIVFISSTSVYDNNDSMVNEKETSIGNSQRGKNVFDAETELQKAVGSRLTIIRMAGLVGKDRHPVKFMTGKNYAGKSEPINLIHLADCIGLIDAVLEKSCWGETINGCSGEHPEKGEYYTWAANELNLHPPNFSNEITPYKIISNEKSRLILGYSYIYDSPFEFPL